MSIGTATDLIDRIGLAEVARKAAAVLSNKMATMPEDQALAFYTDTMAWFAASLTEVEVPNVSPETSEYVRRAFLAYVEARNLGPLLPTGGTA